MRLEAVIAPTRIRQFIDRYLGQQMLLSSGSNGRFAHLLAWHDLNATLNQLRVAGNRLRLVQHGKPVPPAVYLAASEGNSGSPLNSVRFERCLANGATLVLDHVEELFPPIRRLADTFEEEFRVRAQVNLYAGWRTERGFDLHYDDHDTMILQVHGRKHWKVYEPTRLHPLNRDKDIEPAPEPTGPPVWDGILEDGGMLYMPRGWWHVACPLDEPSMHLTVGLSHPTGMQLLAWVVNELKASVEARMDVPHLKSAEEQKAWVGALRTRFVHAWDDTIVDRFMAFWDSKAVARPDVHLPDTAARNIALTPDTRVRLARGRRLFFTDPDAAGTVRFLVDDKPWTCAAALVPALCCLSHIRSCSIRDMRAAIPSASGPALTLLLTAMVLGGIASLQPARASENVSSPFSVAESRPRPRDRAAAQHP